MFSNKFLHICMNANEKRIMCPSCPSRTHLDGWFFRFWVTCTFGLIPKYPTRLVTGTSGSVTSSSWLPFLPSASFTSLLVPSPPTFTPSPIVCLPTYFFLMIVLCAALLRAMFYLQTTVRNLEFSLHFWNGSALGQNCTLSLFSKSHTIFIPINPKKREIGSYSLQVRVFICSIFRTEMGKYLKKLRSETEFL